MFKDLTSMSIGTGKGSRRIVETGSKECDYMPGSIPVEWEGNTCCKMSEHS